MKVERQSKVEDKTKGSRSRAKEGFNMTDEQHYGSLCISRQLISFCTTKGHVGNNLDYPGSCWD